MSSRVNLLLFLREWRRRTMAETAGIRAQDWATVRECQQAKRQLQTLLDDAVQPHVQPDAAERELVQELIALEAENGRYLEEQKRELEVKRRELEENSRNLVRVRNSYGSAQQFHWQTYS